MTVRARTLSQHLALIGAVRDLYPRHGDWRKVSTADPDPDAGPGWFCLAGRLDPKRVEGLAQARPQHDPESAVYDVFEIVVEGEQVRVRVSASAPARPLAVMLPGNLTRRTFDGIIKTLEARRSNPLLTQFVKQQLTALPQSTGLRSTSSESQLRPAQQDAVIACGSPGVQLVWGPPGTGKTHVIAGAIAQLVASGKRVLLLSSYNIAVDNALHQCLPQLSRGHPVDFAGLAVRVGNIHLPEIAENPAVNLSRLIASRQQDIQHQVDRLAAELAILSTIEQALVGFDPEQYRQAEQRRRNTERHVEIGLLQAARSEEIVRLRARIQRLDRDQLLVDCQAAREQSRRISADLAVIEQALAAHSQSSVWTRLRQSARKGRLAGQRVDLLAEQAAAGQGERSAEAAAALAGLDPQTAPTPDPAATAAALRARHAEQDAAQAALHELSLESDGLLRAGLAGPEDHELLGRCAHQWQQYAAVSNRDVPAEQAALRRQLAPLEKALNQGKSRIEQDLIDNAKLVATTLSQIAVRSGIGKQPYDFVIIDEAATASLPMLLQGVALATAGATLVGDFRQNTPIAESDSAKVAELNTYLKTDCFSHFGVTSPATAVSVAGCVVLHEQFRFGSALTALANEVAYGGVLKCMTRPEEDDGEIVVVTVDGLSEAMSGIRRTTAHAGWWVVGTLLAQALAEQYSGDFGVVVPYRLQVDASQAALDDAAGSRGTPVGTSHAFQGRQFSTVLADLVEDGQGWLAQARLESSDGTSDDYKADGVRLFNVAVTRAQRRLYVLVGQRALEQAEGAPLAALRTMIAQGHARQIAITAVLGLSDSGQDDGAAVDFRPGSAEAELKSALQRYVRVADVLDEDVAIEEIVARVEGAQVSVWCWSAWIGRGEIAIQDALARAHERGVQVWVIARPPEAVTTSNRQSLAKLANRLPGIRYMHDMHQKIIVVDRQWTIFGSQNALSVGATSSRRSRDVMVVMDSGSFAAWILRFERADELARDRTCPACGTTFSDCKLVGRDPKRAWQWICRQSLKDPRHQLAFPKVSSPGGRNS